MLISSLSKERIPVKEIFLLAESTIRVPFNRYHLSNTMCQTHCYGLYLDYHIEAMREALRNGVIFPSSKSVSVRAGVQAILCHSKTYIYYLNALFPIFFSNFFERES